YDEDAGEIRNKNRSFFAIKGFQRKSGNTVVLEQPVILQNEIGYLGIICKEIDGVLHFLMQAKIEPGNLNKIQLSPTIQATKSNFTQKHGGKKPKYLDYFINAADYEIIVDQIQSEQSSRFYKKRNRNIIIKVDEDIPLEKNFKWMTLGQIKELMKIDNLVNMDTRTVLSCIPYSTEHLTAAEKAEIQTCFRDEALYYSMFEPTRENLIPILYRYINNYKMFAEGETRLVPLHELKDWEFTENEIHCKHDYDFKVVYCDIEMEGREVKQWTQPLFEAIGIAVFGLFTCVENGVRKFLVHAKPEVGCHDFIELGPTVQMEPSNKSNRKNELEEFFFTKLEEQQGIKKNVLLSEEGGRFYHEQNQNVIIEVEKEETGVLPEGYFWVDYATLNRMVQINNCLNIQLRNLLSLLDI
ncbi:MAG: NDP-hexose 2,3-dehydratase family protein, partial [Lachnospiraceae bacterium]|nr:NDP-hexose 2,3-dehydratase family protein [Lachnospiraceae bacterium]